MIANDLEELYEAATHSQKCIQIASGSTPQSYKFLLKWPDLCHSLIKYQIAPIPEYAESVYKDFDEVITKPIKILIEAYVQTLKQLERDTSDFEGKLKVIDSLVGIGCESILERKGLMVELVNKIAAKIRECGVQVEGVYDER